MDLVHGCEMMVELHSERVEVLVLSDLKKMFWLEMEMDDRVAIR